MPTTKPALPARKAAQGQGNAKKAAPAGGKELPFLAPQFITLEDGTQVKSICLLKPSFQSARRARATGRLCVGMHSGCRDLTAGSVSSIMRLPSDSSGFSDVDSSQDPTRHASRRS